MYPAHGGVHAQSLACASDDPGEPVVEAQGGQAVADPERADQIVNDDDGGIHGNLRADHPVRTLTTTASFGCLIAAAMMHPAAH